MPNLADHAREHRRLLDRIRVADLAEAERTERAAVALGLAERATNLRQLQLRHPSSPPPSRAALPARATPRGSACRARGPRPRAGAAASAPPRRPSAC